MRFIQISCLLFLLFCQGNALAQDFFDFKERNLQKAFAIYKQGDVKKADKLFKEVALNNLKNPIIISRIGTFYFNNNRFMDAAYYFEMGSKSINKGKQIYSLPLAKSFYRAGLPEKAWLALSEFPKNSNVAPETQKEINQLQKNIQFARLVSYNTHNVKVENLRWPVNSELDEYAPSFSFVTSDLVFNRRVNGLDEDFFIAHLDSCYLWNDPKDLGFPLNSNAPESYQNRAFSGKYMLYQKCENRSVNGWERGGCDLYLSFLTQHGWSDPRPFFYTINTVAFEGMPSLSADETVLYFVSEKPGGYGGKDIYRTSFVNGKWQAPVNLGPNVNTEKDEISPVIAADGKTLYFASDGHPGFGGFDMFVSKMQIDSSMTKAVNLGAPINTFYNETLGSVNINGNNLYFSSDRFGGFGGYDIYKAEIPKQYCAKPVTMVYGSIRDFETGNIISSSEIVLKPQTGFLDSIVIQGNKGDGSFYYPLPKGATYQLKIAHSFYQDLNEEIKVSEVKELDSFDFKLYIEGYQPTKKSIDLMQFSYLEFDLSNEDSLCLKINEQLQTYSGRLVNVTVDNYFRSADSNKVNAFTAALYQCFYKMGIGDAYINFQNWEVIGSSNINTYADKIGKSYFKIEVLEQAENEE